LYPSFAQKALRALIPFPALTYARLSSVVALKTKALIHSDIVKSDMSEMGPRLIIQEMSVFLSNLLLQSESDHINRLTNFQKAQRLHDFCTMYLHSRKQKLAALYIQVARQAVQSSSEFYDFLQLYIFYFCLLTDTEQNRIVRANYYLMSECNMVVLHNSRSD
jgi:hypothetical protein